MERTCISYQPIDSSERIIRDSRLVHIAEETVAILEQGRYQNRLGEEVSFAPEIEFAIQQTKLVTPEEGDQLHADHQYRKDPFPPLVHITDETTQKAAQRLVQQAGQKDLAVLNFASARKPGGGFLNGAPAQEESIARCSGLYPALLTQPGYYQANRAKKSRLYTDHIIYSPDVPWFRSEDYALLDDMYLASIITAPAPNAGSLRNQEKKQLEHRLRERAGKILAVAESEGHRSLLLGAWGCGVFKNDPEVVADAFGTWLESPRFMGSFDYVTFAIYDSTSDKQILKAFADRLS